MLRNMPRFSLAVIVLASALAFAGCAPMPTRSASPTPAPAEQAPEPAMEPRGGTIIGSSFADAESLNPILYTDEASSEVCSMMFNALVQLDPEDASVVPDLAERWEVSDDELTFTYYLRKNVTWHDGAPFTAADVKFTYETMIKEEVNSPWCSVRA